MGVWNGYKVLTDYVASISAIVYYTAVDVDEEDAYLAFSLSDGAPLTRYVMSYSGKMELQSWNNASMGWDTIGASPRNECSTYGYCGAFGYCDYTGGTVPSCKCLEGFAPTNRDEWSNGRFSQGCQRREALRCGRDGDGFLALPNMKAPDRFVLVRDKSFDECAAECSRNCSCVAYAYANLSSSSKWNPTRCLVWTGELIDMQKTLEYAEGSDTLYLRLAGLDTGKRTERKAMQIVLPVLASVLLTFICLIVWVFMWKGTCTLLLQRQAYINFCTYTHTQLYNILTREEMLMTFWKQTIVRNCKIRRGWSWMT